MSFLETQHLTIANHAVSYRAAGRGPVLVLAHGFLGSSVSWSQVVFAMARKRRIIALDLPGHGESWFEPTPEGHSMQEASDALSELLRIENIEGYDLWGYSMGGRFALYHALLGKHPPRRLVLESASAGIQDEGERKARAASDEALAKQIESDGMNSFVEQWEALPLFASQQLAAPQRLASQRQIRRSTRPEGAALSLRGMGTGTQAPCQALLGDLRAHTLVVSGALDAKFSEIASGLASGLRHALAIEVPGAGHNVHLEQTATMTKLVEAFLDADNPTNIGLADPQPE